MSDFDYGPDIDSANEAYRNNPHAQETLANLMNEIERAERVLAHMKAQKEIKRTEVRNCERELRRLQNSVRDMFVNYMLGEALLPDGSIVVDDPRRDGAGNAVAFRPIRKRR